MRGKLLALIPAKLTNSRRHLSRHPFRSAICLKSPRLLFRAAILIRPTVLLVCVFVSAARSDMCFSVPASVRALLPEHTFCFLLNSCCLLSVFVFHSNQGENFLFPTQIDVCVLYKWFLWLEISCQVSRKCRNSSSPGSFKNLLKTWA